MRQLVFSLARRAALLTGLLLTAHIATQAHGVPGGGTTGGPPAPTAVPLDGSAALLVASGLSYGLRRLRRRV